MSQAYFLIILIGLFGSTAYATPPPTPDQGSCNRALFLELPKAKIKNQCGTKACVGHATLTALEHAIVKRTGTYAALSMEHALIESLRTKVKKDAFHESWYLNQTFNPSVIYSLYDGLTGQEFIEAISKQGVLPESQWIGIGIEKLLEEIIRRIQMANQRFAVEATNSIRKFNQTLPLKTGIESLDKVFSKRKQAAANDDILLTEFGDILRTLSYQNWIHGEYGGEGYGELRETREEVIAHMQSEKMRKYFITFQHEYYDSVKTITFVDSFLQFLDELKILHANLLDHELDLLIRTHQQEVLDPREYLKTHFGTTPPTEAKTYVSNELDLKKAIDEQNAVYFVLPGRFYQSAESVGHSRHAAVVVGYSSSPSQNLIRVQNSWGPYWGKEGYKDLPLEKVAPYLDVDIKTDPLGAAFYFKTEPVSP